MTAPLFGEDYPPGLAYSDAFISVDEEASLSEAIERVEFSDFEMRGAIARRRVAFFGRSYFAPDREDAPIPLFLDPVRDRLAEWAGIPREAFAMALINKYPPGAPIGWHRDAPQYEIVAGLSLLSPCEMRFRPYVARAAARATSDRRRTTHRLPLPPRSAYLLTGEARSGFEHSIVPVQTLRYSITFRTLRSAR